MENLSNKTITELENEVAKKIEELRKTMGELNAYASTQLEGLLQYTEELTSNEISRMSDVFTKEEKKLRATHRIMRVNHRLVVLSNINDIVFNLLRY